MTLQEAQPQPQTTHEQAPSAYHQGGQYGSPGQSSNYMAQSATYSAASYEQPTYLSQSAPAPATTIYRQPTYNQAQDNAQNQQRYHVSTAAATATATSVASHGVGHAGTAFRQQGKFIKGTPGARETFDPEYKVRKDKKDFFHPERVFKVYWSEPKGQQNQTTLTGGDSGANYDRFGQAVHSKIRWFLVIKCPRKQNFSYCLPIQTYEGRGVAKNGVTKCYHSIIHTSSTAPQPKPNELPDPNLQPNATGEVQAGWAMLRSIRVRTRKKSDKMDEMSRPNYIKIYPVEHNVKVYDFGKVDHSHLHILKAQFKWVQQMADDDEDEDEGENDDDEDDEDDDEDEEEDDDEDEDDDGPSEQPSAPVSGKGKSVSWEKPRPRRKSSGKDQERPRKDDKSKSSSGGRKKR
ncbi:hypothetical protein FKW77_004737 [Venturia effusa]|uniref:DUF6590 domain-containing protein n=1 Tax=Venturia effusa TaxID=50376 RepID=A0A517L195_9PEZI|nr:hypothetical protein FKW77_004737 [Venturia effusa]